MKNLRKWITIMVMGLSVSSMAYGANASKAAFAQNLDALQIGSNKVHTSLEGDLTREEAAVLIVEELGYTSLAKAYAGQNTFKDVTTHKGEINLVKALNLMSGTSETSFNPKGNLSSESAKTILSRIQAKLNTPLKWQHACYAISSSSQMDKIKDYDAISFGWAHLDSDSFKINTTSGDFKVPTGFEKAVDEAQNNGVEAYLMVYYDNKGNKAGTLLKDSQKRSALIKEIIDLCEGMTKDGQTRSFQGVTIDLEQFTDVGLKQPYVTFLKELKVALKAKGKKLNVAVQPTTYFKGYDYKGIGSAADHVIVMAHDYGAKKLTKSEQEMGITNTPITPINEVYQTLKEATKTINKDKIALQISYASTQWQSKNNKVINSTAYTPNYAQIQSRLNQAGTKVLFDEISQDTYATYISNDISNVIWYEDERSITAKVDLAKILGITGISYWRLGNMPN